MGITSDVIEVPCIQQNQTFECGMHVVAKYIPYHYCANDIEQVISGDQFSGVPPNPEVYKFRLKENKVKKLTQSTEDEKNKPKKWPKV